MYEIDILVPARNEAENLPELLKRIDRAFVGQKSAYRVILIDDNSTDNTSAIATKLAQKYPLLVHKKIGQPGKAFALIEGAALSTAPYLGMIDADLEYPPEALPQMLGLAKTQGVAVANRVTSHKSKLRQAASNINRFIFGRFVLGLKCDVQSGLKVFPREVMTHLDHKQVKSWSIDMPLLHTAQELGYSIATIDITFTPRTLGISKCKAELSTAVRQIAVGALRVKFSKKRHYVIPPTTSKSSLGAGMIIKKQRFITHTQLPQDYSASRTIHTWQIFFIWFMAMLLVAGLIFSPQKTAIIFVGLLTSVYFIDVLFNFFLVLKSLHFPPELTFAPEQLRRLNDKDLPMYTILCPLYREARVLPDFVANISTLDWPKNRLDVILLLEEDDQETITAAREMKLPNYFQVLVVPHSLPKTKPKACNYGLLYAKGEYIVVYDAEDKPDPDQLKKAYLGFKNSSQKIACFQAKLNYFNPHQNLLTRLFTSEYSLWFDVILPGLQSINTTIPLGGTSNHFRTEILRQLHGWDAFNVTEDCDLGARLFKSGYVTAIIDSTTLEEANSKVGNWIRQRSRWIKGYIQTYLIHNRHPLKFIRSHGIHALIFQLVVGGKIAFMLINPFLWLLTISYFVLYRFVGPTIESLYPPAIFYMAIVSLVFGNFLFLYYYMIGVAKRGHWSVMKYVFLIPIYWIGVSLAAFKAFNQLIFKPHYWEKTNHGLHIHQQKTKSPVTIPEVVKTSVVKTSPKSSVVIDQGLFIAAAMLANLLNFLYAAYLGRISGFAEYGLISLIGSFLNFSQIPLSSFSRTLTNKVAFLYGKYDTYPKGLWKIWRRRALPVSVLVTILWLVSVPVLMHFFNTDRAFPFLAFTPIWFVGVTAAVDTGFLNGSHRFRVIALMTAVEAIVKFTAAWLLVNNNLPEYVYIAIPVGAVVSFVIGWIYAHSLKSTHPITQLNSSLSKRMFGSNILTKISTISFINLDLVLAKHFLSPDEAGHYAFLSLVGNMVYFVGILFNQFINPLVGKHEGAGTKSKHVFYISLIMALLASSLGVLLVGVFGFYTVPLLFGSKAEVIVPLLPAYTFSMACIVVGTTIVAYHQARHQHGFAIAGFIASTVMVVAIFLNHDSIWSISNAEIFGGFFYLLTVMTMHLFANKITWIWRNLCDFFDLFSFTSPETNVDQGQLKILIFNWRDTKHIWAGGAEVYLHELARRWVEKGHSVTQFCGNDGNNPRSETIDGVKIIRRGGFFTVYLWAMIYYLAKFRGKYDLVIDGTNGAPFFTPIYVKVPQVLLIHHVNQELFRTHLPWFISPIARFVEGKVMPLLYRNHQVVTVSHSSKKDIVDKLGFKASHVAIIHPGVSIKPFSLKKLANPSFIYLGRLKPHKNIDVAINAFAKILPLYPKAKLTIAGDGESRPKLERLVAQLGLEKSITFLGKVSDTEKATLLASHWVALQPSSTEGWGITVTEANMCKTPVIASNIHGLRDSIIDNQTGILVPVGSVDAFASAMTRLVDDAKFRQSLSSQAFIWSKSFDWEKASTEFIGYLKNNLSKKRYQFLPISA